MRGNRSIVLFLTLLAAGLPLVACGDAAQTEEGAATQKAAIEAYCDRNSIDIPQPTLASDGYGDKPTVSKEDPGWEIDFAFPAEAEGAGQFFLLHKTDGGWTADELKNLGAPTDIVLDPTQ